MFNFVREKKWVVYTILTLIILSFGLWGVSSYDLSGQSAGVVATVNGSKITQQEFDAALRQQQNRMREQLGENFDAALLDTPEMRRSMMDNLITQRVLIERAKAARLVVTDAQMAEVIGSIDAFHEGGKFDSKRYVAVLSNNNMSPLLYETRLRDELLGQKMQETYAENGYAPNSVVENIFRLNQQQRTVSVSPVSLQAFTAQAKVDEAATKKYYDQHQSEFQVPEQARVEFVKLSTNNLMDKIEIKPEEARNYYQQHLSDFGAPEQRQAAHILINMSFAASQAEQDAARDKAAQLLKQVKQNPAKFAEIAKLNSQDTGSAVQGGDLGFFGRGMMVKPFEEAAFSLKVGDISELVRSDFGYHIIKLIAVKPSRAMSFDEARSGIINKLREQKAADQLAELADKFSNTIYEQSDTLKPAAAQADAKIEQSGWLSKGAATAEPWTAKMLQAIFNDEVVKNKRNTAAIEVAPNVLVAARILEHKPAAALPFSIAQETIRQKLLRQQALELAVKQGKSLLEQLQHRNKPVLSWGTAQSVTRMQHGSLDESMIKQIFRADAARLPQYVGAETAQDGYVLVRIDAAKEGEAISDAKRDQYARQLRQLTGETLFQSYLAEAKQQAKIEVSLPEKNTEKTTE